MTEATDPAAHTRPHTAYSAVVGIALFSLWLIAGHDAFIPDYYWSASHPGYSHHNMSFLIFSTIFGLALWRRFALRNPDKPAMALEAVSLGAHVALMALAIMRGIETFGDAHIPLLDSALGALDAKSYVAFWTIAGLLTLSLHLHYMRDWNSRLGRVVSNALLACVLMLYLHQIHDLLTLEQGRYILPGVSIVSSCLILIFALYTFPYTPAWQAMFNPQTPKSNITGFVCLAGILLGQLAFQSAETLPVLNIALALGAGLLLGVFLSVFRPLEIRARYYDQSLQPQKAATEDDLDIAPSEREPARQSPVRRALHDISFTAPDSLRFVIQALITFALAYGAIVLSRLSDEGIAAIWWANAYLAYCLIVRPERQWVGTMLVFCASVLFANIVAQNSLPASAILTVINVLEGTFLAIINKAVFGLSVQKRRVLKTDFDARKVLISMALSCFAIFCTAMLGGGVVTQLFGGDPLANVMVWASGSLIGIALASPIAYGYLMEIHWGYRPLRINREHLLIGLGIYVLAVAAFAIIATFFPSIPKPHIGFMLFVLPLACLPSLLWAGCLLALGATVYFYIGAYLWHDLWAGALQFPIVVIFTSNVLLTAIIIRYLSDQMRSSQRALLKDSPHILLATTRNGRIVHASKRVGAFSARPVADLIGMNLFAAL